MKQNSDPEDDQHLDQGFVVGGSDGDRQLLGQQVGVLGKAPGPNHQGRRPHREHASEALGAAAQQHQHSDAAGSRKNRERQRLADQAVV